MVQGTILEHLEGRKFVIEIPELPERQLGLPSTKTVSIQHDFIKFDGDTSYYMKPNKKGEYPIKTRGACNHLSTRASLQIGIRDFKEFYLPLILSHEYFQNEHLADRTYDKDDESWESRGLNEPRYKAGDKYPAYAYNPVVIQYYDRTAKQRMVAFRAKGEKHYSRVSLDIFKQIKNTLNLSKFEPRLWDKVKNEVE